MIIGLLTSGIFSQTYTHPTVGLGGTFVGSCMVSTCSGTYTDNGGAGNYAASVNNIYRTFCPNSAGMCLRATFTSFSMNDTYFLCFGPSSCCDYLQILNGPAQNSPVLYSNCTASPGTITASNPTGCLTFRFVSDGSVQLAGWSATLSCVACGGGPAGNTRADCQFNNVLCASTTGLSLIPGPGIVSEGCSGCNVGGEVYSSWYRFNILTSGTLGFTIDPNVNSDDFDYALFGPNVTCGALGSPIRCSAAASFGTGNTGIGNGAADVSEDVAGDQWTSLVNVTAGQSYLILLKGWSAAMNPFSITFTGTATLNCVPLPVELSDFTCYPTENNEIELHWKTTSETNNDHFIVEKSIDGINYTEMARLQGNQNSNQTIEYITADINPVFGNNYYRLTQVDLDGNFTNYDPISCNYGDHLSNIEWIEVYDINGRIALKEKVDSKDFIKTVTSLPVSSGMYILYTYYEGGKVEVRKFVKA